MKHTFLLLIVPAALAPQAAGQFATGQSLGSVSGIYDLATSDVNGDGRRDLVAASNNTGNVVWLPNSGGNGTYGTAQVIASGLQGPRSIEIGDLDGDGLDDIVATSTNRVVFIRKLGPGVFATAAVLSSTLSRVEDCALGDIDGDGDRDVVVVSYNDDKVTWFQNQGGGTFAVEATISTAGDGPRAVALGDIDGDGRLDVAVTSERDDEVSWYRNLGSGMFGPQLIVSSAINGAVGLALADVDANGTLDVICSATFGDRVFLFRGLGSGIFGPEEPLDLAANGPTHITVADVDLDGDLDIVVSVFDGDDVRLYENNGMGFFGAPISLAPVGSNRPNGAYRPLVFDADGDADNDVLTGAFNGGAVYWFQNLRTLGTTYCTSHPNSTGTATVLEVTGTSISGFNRLALTARDMPTSSTGFFLTSRTPGMVNMPAGSSGVLCLGGQIGRYVGPGQTGFSGAARRIRLVVDLTRTPTPGGLMAVMPGQTWHFQAWHRDVVGGTTTSNFSNGVLVSFQ